MFMHLYVEKWTNYIHKKQGYDVVVSRSKAWFCSITDFNKQGLGSKEIDFWGISTLLPFLPFNFVFSGSSLPDLPLYIDSSPFPLPLPLLFPYLTSPCTLAAALVPYPYPYFSLT